MGKNTEDAGYKAAVGSAKRVIKILIYVFIALVIILLGKTTYSLGYDVFNQEAMDTEADAKEVTVTITDDMSVRDIGKLLKEKGLIEKPLVFTIQEKLSDYSGEIRPGTYELNTSMKVDDMLRMFAETEEEKDGE